MAVRIAHSSIDERGKASGGAAGDQTGKEVCIRNWYSKPWEECLIPINADIGARVSNAMVAICNNNNIGYDQGDRNSLKKQAVAVNWDFSRITVKCECDCSSAISVAVESCGAKVPYSSGNAPTTRTIADALVKSGYYKRSTDKKYLTTSDYLGKGYILNKKGSHVVCAIDNGPKYEGAISSGTTPRPEPSSGELLVDGDWGRATTTKLQQKLGTPVDGIISNQYASIKAKNPGLDSGSWKFHSNPSSAGSSCIRVFQKMVGAKQDGFAGPDTFKCAQKYFGTYVDGCVSKPSNMVKAMQRWLNS